VGRSVSVCVRFGRNKSLDASLVRGLSQIWGAISLDAFLVLFHLRVSKYNHKQGANYERVLISYPFLPVLLLGLQR
jgi:hypothetical protein